MHMNTFSVFQTMLGTFLLYYFYRCIVVVKENQYKNINRFGRYHRTISGSRERVALQNGQLVLVEPDQTNDKKFVWIWWLVDSVAWYLFTWVEAMSSSKAKTKKGKVLWGDVEKDAEVSFERSEWTNHHKDQHDYRFRVNNLETGKNIKKDTVTEEKKNKKETENVKVDFSLNGTVKMMNVYDAQYRTGGEGDWYGSLAATLTGVLGEVVGNKIYSDLHELRGDKIESIEVRNTEPEKGELVNDPSGARNQNGTPKLVAHTPLFADRHGNRLDTIRFIDRINYEMLFVKRLGVMLINITIMDYEVSEESQQYVKALQENAISVINLETSKNKAFALRSILEPKKKFVLDIVQKAKDAQILIKKAEDVTITKKAQAQPNLRVEVASGQSDRSFMPNVNELVNLALGMDIAKEIDVSGDETKSPPADQKKITVQKKHHSNQKGGNDEK